MRTEESPLLLQDATNHIEEELQEDPNKQAKAAADVQQQKASNFSTALNMAKTCMGTGCLALPYACQQGGMIIYIIGLIVVAVWNVYSVHLLCRSTNHNNSLQALAQATYGGGWEQVINRCLQALLLGIIVAYLSAVIQLGEPLVPRVVTASISAILICGISMVPHLGWLSPVSAVGLVVLVGVLLTVLAYGEPHWTQVEPWPASWHGLAQTFGVVVFGFGVVPLTFFFKDSMQHPTQITKVTATALGGTCFVYALAGTVLYAYFPQVSGDILTEIPLLVDSVVQPVPLLLRLAMVLVVVLSAPLLVVPLAELLEDNGPRSVWVRSGICVTAAMLALEFPQFVQVLSLVGGTCVALVSFVLPPLFARRVTTTAATTGNWMNNLLVGLGVAVTLASTWLNLQVLWNE